MLMIMPRFVMLFLSWPEVARHLARMFPAPVSMYMVTTRRDVVRDVIRTEFFRPVKRPFEIVAFWSLTPHFSLQNNVLCQNMFTCKSSSSYCTIGPALRRLRHVPIPKLFCLEGLELTQAETALQGFQNRQVTSCGARAAPDIALEQFPTQRPESRERCHPQMLPRMAM